jgi:hypothetical protein
MALYVRKDNKRSELQQKIASELQEKLNKTDIEADQTDPAFLDDSHHTRPAGMVIMVLLLLLAIAIGAIMVRIVTQN